jgi:endonuclease/exonuclease/phosphatase family metal-dependent hydrolase
VGRAVEWAGVVYLVLVVAAAALLALVGERWWVTTAGLYLPRVVLLAPLPLLAVALWRLRSPWVLGAQGVTLFVVLVPLMGLSVPAPALPSAHAEPTPRVRVLSYNINSSLGGLANLMAEVDRYAPDVVFMQEIGDPVALSRAMKERFPTVLVSGQFLSATRYPVLSKVDPETLPFGGRQRTARFLELTLGTPLGDVAFYNVHPISPRDELTRLRGRGLRREILSGHIFSGDAAGPIQANAELRELQVQTFADAASHETIPTVIAGDTNLPGSSAVARRQLGRFQDGFTKAGWGFGYTFPTNHFPWMRIDRVFASDDLRFSSFRVGTSDASDHLCVVADLQRR